jgi:hypothetical protein
MRPALSRKSGSCYVAAEGDAMATTTGRLDALGRLFFRALGTLCALAALGCLAGIAWVVRNESGGEAVAAIAMVLVAGGLATWCAAHCFSRKRTFEEALDSLTGVPLDPREKRHRRSP